jgi:hypothetical protein
MVAETAKSEDNATARALIDRLGDVTDDFVARHGLPEAD